MSNFYRNDDYFGNFFKMINDSWYNYVIYNNKSFMELTEKTYDNTCRLICDILKPQVLQMARDYSRQLEEQKKIQNTQIENMNR